jgi:hypothetical protein
MRPVLKERLLKILGCSTGERKVHQFLKQNADIVFWAFSRMGGHQRYVIAQFRFGSNYVADFVVLFSYSGAWEVHFIELEPPGDNVITKSGRPTKRLNSAISRIGDWKDFVEQNRAFVRKELSDWCRKKPLSGLDISRSSPHGLIAGSTAYDMSVDFEYHIVIGRRESVTNEKRRKMQQLQHDGRICTYDGFVDIAHNLDRVALNTGESVYVAERQQDF